MRKREYRKSAPLIALTGMALLGSAAFAQAPRQVLPAGPVDQARPQLQLAHELGNRRLSK